MSKAQASASSFGALKEDFLFHRYITGLHAENIKNRWLQILLNRMGRMSDTPLLKTIRELSESGALEMAAIIGIPMPGENLISTISIPQAFGVPGEGLQSSLGDRATCNPVKETGELLEAIEHIERHFRGRQIKPTTEGG
jgi:hypothetical protein